MHCVESHRLQEAATGRLAAQGVAACQHSGGQVEQDLAQLRRANHILCEQSINIIMQTNGGKRAR